MSAAGKVFLVGAGPGDPDLLTLKAAKALRAADVVLHDELVSAEILRLIPATAEILNVGKRCGKPSTSQSEINRLLVNYGLLGLNVVRLKGGDPFIFGRGGEELEALQQSAIEVEIIPGVTAALGAAAGAQVPLTHRDLASSVVFVTGSSKQPAANWPDRLPSNATVVVYMPGHDLALVQRRLTASGISAEAPCAIISRATTGAEQVYLTNVGKLFDAPRLGGPRLLVIGEVVRLADPQGLKHQFRQFALSHDHNQLSFASTESAE